MEIPGDLKFTSEHEWLKVEGSRASVGITHYASEQLGDIVYVDLPKVGTAVAATQPFGAVESVKAASDLFSPVTGTVVAINGALADHPEYANTDPYGEGWMVTVELSDPGEVATLMDAAAYEQLLAAEG
jgi:glycine cleavage system H protein